MNSQFKRGVLELCLLHVLEDQPMSTYDVLALLSEKLDINENTVYPLLRRLEQDALITHEKRYGEMGAPRKVYLLTEKGRREKQEKHTAWSDFISRVQSVLGGHHDA